MLEDELDEVRTIPDEEVVVFGKKRSRWVVEVLSMEDDRPCEGISMPEEAEKGAALGELEKGFVVEWECDEGEGGGYEDDGG